MTNNDNLPTGAINEEGEKRNVPINLLNSVTGKGLPASATGANIPEPAGEIYGELTPVQKSDIEANRAKINFFNRLKLIVSIIGFIISIGIIGGFLWYIDHSNKISSDISEYKTEIQNLKDNLKTIREEHYRDIDKIQGQFDKLESKLSNSKINK